MNFPAADAPHDPNRLRSIDALRGFAALYVVGFHLYQIADPAPRVPWFLKPILINGGSGVYLFFLISAFTLCLTTRSRSGETHSTLRFYVRRFFRIAPLYYAWLALMFFIERDAGRAHTKLEWLACATFTHNFIPGWQEGIVWASWTLGVEMVFYVMFPAIFRFASTLGRSLVLVAATLALSAGFGWAISQTSIPERSPSFVHFNLITNLPLFAIGIVVYHVYERWSANRTAGPRTGLALLVGAGAGFAAIVGFVPMDYDWVRIGGFGLVYLLLILGLIARPIPVVVSRATVFLGVISYSLYLNHPILINRGLAVSTDLGA